MITEIWSSFRALPLWVQIWVAAILVPVNLLSLAYVTQPFGWLVALLAVGGMIPNLPIMIVQRGFSRLMSLPHLLIWGLLMPLLIWLIPQVDGGYKTYLLALAVINAVSLVFDAKDMVAWFKGARDAAR